MIKLCCNSIRSQIILLIILMTLLPLGINVSDAIRQYRHDVDDAVNLASSITSQVHNDQNTQLAAANQLANTLSLLPSVQKRDSGALNSLLAQTITTNPAYAEISLLDASGSLWASTDPSNIGSSHADRSYFRNTVVSGKVSAGEYADASSLKVPALTLGYPIKDSYGAVTNVCVIALGLDRYRQLYQDRYPSPLSAILLVDHNGIIRFSTTDSSLVGKQDRSDLFKQMAEGADSGSFDAIGNLDVRRLYAYRKLRLQGESTPYLYVRSGLSKKTVLNNIYTDLWINCGSFLFFMSLVLVLAIYISKRGILDKVAFLQEAARTIANGNFESGLPNPASNNELDQLGCSLTDMAQQLHQARAALQQSFDDYRELVESANSIILKWDFEGKILFYNEYAQSFFGFSPDEILGQSVIGTIVPETESSSRDLAEMIRNISRNPEKYLNSENENIRKNGERVWISWSNHALTTADGSRLGILSVGLDITARKGIELELMRSEERFRSFVENANDVVFALTPEGVFSYVSARWKDAFGYEISETVGKPFVPFVHPDDVQSCFEFLQKVLVTGEKQSGVEYRVLCKDGRFLWYKANGSLIHDPENNSCTFIGIGRDITERKKAEETLRQSEEKFAAAFRASPDAVTLTRLSDGIYLEVNEGFTNLTGYRQEEAVGKSSVELGLWADPHDRTLLGKRLEASGMVTNMEAKFCRKDGTLLTGQMSVRIIEIDGTPCLLGITRDITEHDFLQNELIKAQKLESIGVLAGGIAHNFNNVLTGVIGYISYAKKHLMEPDKILPILESAEKSSYRAAGLARQLLTFSKGDTPVKKPVPVDVLVQESVSLFLTGTNIRADINCHTHQTVHVDCQQINQAFNNIILNAVHAMPDGGVLTVRSESVTLPANSRYSLPSGNYVKIDFQDSGCGIQKDDLHKIYDPYFTTKESGTGLGLSTTLSIISKHNGHIDVTSEAGKGTKVTMLLPASAEESAGNRDAAKLNEQNPDNISILLMDDEEMIRDLANNLLSEQSYDVTTCVNGEAAVELYKAAMAAGKVFSVVVLDLLIPGDMGGIETAKRILEVDANAALIISSGNANDPAIAEYERYGFSGAISKPYNAEQLIQSIMAAAATHNG